MTTAYVPFRVRRTFDNPSRRRPNLFRIELDRGAPEGKGHDINFMYEAPDEKTKALLEGYVNAGSMAARPRIKVRNGKDGWEIVKPLEIIDKPE